MKSLEKKSIHQFNSWAKDYDQKKSWQYFFSNRGLLSNLNPQERAAILDVGCATGTLLLQLARLNKNLKLYGVDIAPEMVRAAKNKLKERANLQVATANKLPFKNNIFDFVTCATSFHHYPNSQHALQEMFRVLKPQGKLILLDPFTSGFLRKSICKALDIIFQEQDTHLFTKEQMHHMFQKAGFKRIEQNTYLFYKLITIGYK